jgi:ankyrin repeat protein
MGMCRFTGLEDVEYKKVSAALCRMTRAVSRGPGREEIPSLDTEQRRVLLDSLRYDQIDARQMTIKSGHAKTCKWLLKMQEYLDWLDVNKLVEHHGFLWIKGKPGTGKSTLMKFAHAHARKTMKDKIITPFFFNARGEDLEKSTAGMYRSLLLQLLEKIPELQCVFDSLGSTAKSSSRSHQWSVETLKELFEQAIQLLGKRSLICFIDALDECEERQIRDMVAFFEQLGELAISAGIRFQVCFSSRHYPHITISKGLDLVLEGQEGHDQDITNYLDSELKIGHGKLAKEIRGELQSKASGVFMWVVLVVEILNKENDGGRVHVLRQKLRDIPNDLHELFRQILMRDSYNRDELLLCIQWILFAKQPLKPEELYFAILSGVAPEVLGSGNIDEITMDVMKKFILNSSKGLAEITKSKTPTVQFIHESVRDFLVKENGLGELFPGLGGNFQGQSHDRLKQCCLIYMGIDHSAHLDIGKPLPEASEEEATDLRQLATKMFPFLEYAIRMVLCHADAAESRGVDQGDLIRSFPLDNWIKLSNLFEKAKVRRYTQKASLLYILAESNLQNLIKIHPNNLSYLEVEDERYGLPFFAGLATGSKEAVQTFIALELDKHTAASKFRELCSQYGYDESKSAIFGRSFKFSNRRTIVSYMVENGDEMLLAFVLGTGNVNADIKDNDGQTPLCLAAGIGNEAVIKLLLVTGEVDINSSCKKGWTPFFWAARNGHEAVMKLLLATGKVNIDSRDKRKRTPLSWAVENGHEAIVKLLLATGKVDTDLKNKDGRTPLSWAAGRGHEAIVKLLLSTGKVDMDSRDAFDFTPLSCAAEYGHEAIVKLLLSTGKVDVDSIGKNGWTPFLFAARQGHEVIVKLLLSTGKVDVDSRYNPWNRTPLSWTAENGHEAVVKLLLETGKVNIDSRDQRERTPLSWAAGNGHKAVVKLLLETGEVDADSRDNGGRTPLSWAAVYGHIAVVKLLLETGEVDADSRDNLGRTPLWHAVGGVNSATRQELVPTFLATGNVDPSATDNSGISPLARLKASLFDNRAEFILEQLLVYIEKYRT